jgi:hypothetical protein
VQQGLRTSEGDMPHRAGNRRLAPRARSRPAVALKLHSGFDPHATGGFPRLCAVVAIRDLIPSGHSHFARHRNVGRRGPECTVFSVGDTRASDMRRMRKLVLFALGIAFTLHGQDEQHKVSVGVRAGVPITDAFETFRGNESRYFTNTKRYVIGPTVEFHLPWRFSIRVDALYRRLGYAYEQIRPGVTATRTVANAWDFPATVKWEILPGPIRPFVDAGASVRHVSGVSQVRSVANLVTDLNSAPEFNKRNDIGLVFGGGLAFKFGRVRVSPEFRYVRWGSEAFRDPVNLLLRTNRNQGDFLLGLTF